MAAIVLENVWKTYAGGRAAVRGVDLEIRDGEFLALVGPSGCGKSTLLRLVAGLELPDRGRVILGGRDVTGVPPQERDVAMVFQSYALYPHMTVRENLAFPLRTRGTRGAALDERVGRIAELLGIEALLQQKPRQLSGGQRQRVALGRAMIREPLAFLLDEPLSNLDPGLRVRMRAELSRTHRRLRATMIHVTHDQEEALTLGDRVAVLRDGLLQQAAPPMELYDRPANAFVAGFIGEPAMNLFRAVVRAEAGAALLEGPSFALPIDGAPATLRQGSELHLGVRPHDIELVEPGQGDARGRVETVEPRGREAVIHVEGVATLGGDPVRVLARLDPWPERGAEVWLRLRRDRLHLFEAHGGRRLAG